MKDEYNLWRTLCHLANGLDHLHNLEIVHRDIKPENVMGKFAGTDLNGTKLYHLKICDFGEAVHSSCVEDKVCLQWSE